VQFNREGATNNNFQTKLAGLKSHALKVKTDQQKFKIWKR